MNKIGHFFRWIFLDKESNTWKDYCLKNGLVKEESKKEVKEPISLEKTVEQVKKSGALKGRLKREGFTNPAIEAKKYLIGDLNGQR